MIRLLTGAVMGALLWLDAMEERFLVWLLPMPVIVPLWEAPAEAPSLEIHLCTQACYELRA